jgi:hypothetical protein
MSEKNIVIKSEEPFYTSNITLADVETMTFEEIQERVKFFNTPELQVPIDDKYLTENMPIYKAYLKWPELKFSYFYGSDLYARLFFEVNSGVGTIMKHFTKDEIIAMIKSMKELATDDIIPCAFSTIRPFETIEEVLLFNEAGYVNKASLLQNHFIKPELKQEIELLL